MVVVDNLKKQLRHSRNSGDRLRDGRPEGHFALGLALLRQEREKVIALWQQALSISPDYEPAQYALFEAGEGSEPEEPPSELTNQLQRMGPLVKARMRQPQIYRSGDVTLTLDPGVGFVLEDTGWDCWMINPVMGR